MQPSVLTHTLTLCLGMLRLYADDAVYSADEEAVPDTSGVLFNYIKTVILAERFEAATFLMPLPSLDEQLDLSLDNATRIIAAYWNAIPGDCPELQVAALVSAANDAHKKALQELHDLQEDLRTLLLPPSAGHRKKRFVVATAVAASAATVGLIALGTQLIHGCLAGVLGPGCADDDKIEQNSEAIEAAMVRIQRQQLQWSKFAEQDNAKAYLVAHEFHQLYKTQQTIRTEELKFWNATNETLQGLTRSVRTMNLCTEYLFTRSQINLLRSTITARVQTILPAIEAFRVALWSYRATLLDAIPGMIHGLLPMSLIPKATLTEILEEIHDAQAQSTDRRSLALTLDNILRYYETPLVQRIQSGPHGLYVTVKVPLTSRDRVLDVYEAVPLPMPTDDNRTATLWSTETKHIAVSTNQQENALLTSDQLAACVGPPEPSGVPGGICHHI